MMIVDQGAQRIVVPAVDAWYLIKTLMVLGSRRWLAERPAASDQPGESGEHHLFRLQLGHHWLRWPNFLL